MVRTCGRTPSDRQGLTASRNSRFGRFNSRFDGCNSRLRPRQFPFAVVREFSRKPLIQRSVLREKSCCRDDIPEYFPSNREFSRRSTGRGGSTGNRPQQQRCERIGYLGEARCGRMGELGCGPLGEARGGLSGMVSRARAADIRGVGIRDRQRNTASGRPSWRTPCRPSKSRPAARPDPRPGVR